MQKDRASQARARPNWLKSASQLSHLSSPSQSVFLDWAGLAVAKALIFMLFFQHLGVSIKKYPKKLCFQKYDKNGGHHTILHLMAVFIWMMSPLDLLVFPYGYLLWHLDNEALLHGRQPVGHLPVESLFTPQIAWDFSDQPMVIPYHTIFKPQCTSYS